MPASKMTEDELWQAMADSSEAMTNLIKYNNHLSKGEGLPKDPAARLAAMVANLQMVDKLRKEYDSYHNELQRRYAK